MKKISQRIDSRYETRYGAVIQGNPANHKRAVRFDYSPRGYIGITAYEVDGSVDDRVLLTPQQMKALIVFAKSRGRTTAGKE